MFKILRWLITGEWHSHKWVEYKEYKFTDTNKTGNWTVFVRKCEICGELKNFTNRKS